MQSQSITSPMAGRLAVALNTDSPDCHRPAHLVDHTQSRSPLIRPHFEVVTSHIAVSQTRHLALPHSGQNHYPVHMSTPWASPDMFGGCYVSQRSRVWDGNRSQDRVRHAPVSRPNHLLVFRELCQAVRCG